MSYDNTNTGILFKNDRKLTDSHPDYNGTININGVDHWLSAWIKQGKKGKFMSLSIGAEKEAKPEQKHKDPEPAFDDHIPF